MMRRYLPDVLCFSGIGCVIVALWLVWPLAVLPAVFLAVGVIVFAFGLVLAWRDSVGS